MKKGTLIILIIIIIVIICCLAFLIPGKDKGSDDSYSGPDEKGLSVGEEFVIELEETQKTDGF